MRVVKREEMAVVETILWAIDKLIDFVELEDSSIENFDIRVKPFYLLVRKDINIPDSPETFFDTCNLIYSGSYTPVEESDTIKVVKIDGFTLLKPTNFLGEVSEEYSFSHRIKNYLNHIRPCDEWKKK